MVVKNPPISWGGRAPGIGGAVRLDSHHRSSETHNTSNHPPPFASPANGNASVAATHPVIDHKEWWDSDFDHLCDLRYLLRCQVPPHSVGKNYENTVLSVPPFPIKMEVE